MLAAPFRLAVVAHRDPRGDVGERVDLLVAGLREVTDRVVLVADALNADGRQRAAALADRVVVAPAASALGLIAAGLAAVDDEVRAAASVVVTDTERYGPLPQQHFEAVIASRAPRMGGWTWVPTAPRQEVEPSPWIWVDAATAASPAWSDWWRATRSDRGSLGVHDLVLALRAAGTAVPALREHADARVARATLEEPGAHAFVERALLTADPVTLESLALSGAAARRALQRGGYPLPVVVRDLRRSVPPRRAAVSLGALEILTGDRDAVAASVRVGVLAHIYYPEALLELGRWLAHLQSPWSLVITTGTAASKAEIERLLPLLDPQLAPVSTEVRVVASNRGRDIGAFLVGCADLLRPDADGAHRFDVVVKVHSKRSPQDSYPRATAFTRHLLESLLHSPAHVAELLQLFVDEPELGMAMPPQMHVGYPTLGRAWFGNRPLAERLARRMDIDVPFDDGSPLAPFGSMLVARPNALRPLVDGLEWHDFPDESGYRDGGAAHAVERLFAYAAVSEGYAVRTVTTPEIAAESHQMLEWKLQRILEDVPGTSRQQVQLAATATRALAVSAAAIVRAGRGAERVGRGAVKGVQGGLARLRRGRG